MKNQSNPKNILLLGSYGRGNLGDDAFLLAAIKLFTGHNLFINSADDTLLPAAVRDVVTTMSTTDNHDWRKKLAIFRKLDAIVYCGGDLWVELYGDRFPRISLHKMLIVNLIARLCGKKVFYMGCGIGRLTGYSLWLARASARLAKAVVVREPRSADVLNLPHVRVLPDLVTTVDIAAAPARQADGTIVIGLSILYHLPNPDKAFPELIRQLKQLAERLPSDKFKFVLFPMLDSPAEKYDDVWASEQLVQAVPDADISIVKTREVAEYVHALHAVDILIGARLHANIIALMAGVPSIGISYRPKVAQFFAMNDLGDYCINLEDVTASHLEQKIIQMYNDLGSVRTQFVSARQRNLKERAGYQEFVSTHF